MALPHLKSNYYVLKHAYEENLARKRNFDDTYRQEWKNKVKYFHENEVSANKYNSWSSDKALEASLDAYKRQKSAIDPNISNLQLRRKRLEELLSHERKVYQLELEHEMIEKDNSVDYLKFRAESLKSAREEERKKEARRLYYEHFRLNNPELRKIESEIVNREIIEAWPDQIQEKKKNQDMLEEEERRYQQNLKEEMKQAEQQAQADFQDKIIRERQMKDSLRRQIDEIKFKEQEARKLKELEDQLLIANEEMNTIENQRRKKVELRQKQDYGRALLKQHAAIMRRKSQQIQQEMEEDLRFLNFLAEKDEVANELQTARKEQARRDAEWMRNDMENQLRRERQREIELDSLFAEEAARLWSKREKEWEQERLARNKLMEEVMEDRRSQIQSRIEEARRQQMESLKEREEILDQLQQDKFEETERLESARSRQDEYRGRLRGQIVGKLSQQQRQDDELKLQLQEELDEEQAYEELLRREAEKMRLQGITPRSARR